MIWLDKYQDLCDIGKEWKPILSRAANKTVDEWVKIAERLARKRGGALPSQKWLRRHGYKGLVAALHSYPERFAHIKQESLRGKTIEEHVVEAEKLAKEHNGILPTYKWLNENGYSDLISSLRRRPELFAHIKQDNLRKTVEEHVTAAEKLAKEHGGVIPRRGWLKENGHSGLAFAMRKYPERFSHIKQESLKGETIEKHVTNAEKLAGEHNGILPSCSWLIKHGHSGLRWVLHRHPERFAHIKQERLIKTLEEHIADADRLTREHDGVLPSMKWLKENGYSGLAFVIHDCPELFAHIKQERLIKTVEEHIADAEKLAREHDGVLPTYKWLKKNGYSGLAAMICKYPERFAHIKRMTHSKALRIAC